MSVKRYSFLAGQFRENENVKWVSYEDYKEMSDYADKLVEFGKLPCLPADLENLRTANAQFATENEELKRTLAELRKDLILATL